MNPNEVFYNHISCRRNVLKGRNCRFNFGSEVMFGVYMWYYKEESVERNLEICYLLTRTMSQFNLANGFRLCIVPKRQLLYFMEYARSNLHSALSSYVWPSVCPTFSVDTAINAAQCQCPSNFPLTSSAQPHSSLSHPTTHYPNGQKSHSRS